MDCAENTENLTGSPPIDMDGLPNATRESTFILELVKVLCKFTLTHSLLTNIQILFLVVVCAVVLHLQDSEKRTRTMTDVNLITKSDKSESTIYINICPK